MWIFRNIVRIFYIFLFSEWSSISIRKNENLKQYFIRAASSLAEEDACYKEALKQGLFFRVDDIENQNAFEQVDFSAEAIKIKYEYEQQVFCQIEELVKDINNTRWPYFTFFLWSLKQPISPWGSWYSGVDELYLLAAYIFARKYGATTVQAAMWAHKWLPFQPAYFSAPVVRWLRGLGVGQFINIVYYSIARFFETHLTRPWVIFGTMITIIMFCVLLFFSSIIILFDKLYKRYHQLLILFDRSKIRQGYVFPSFKPKIAPLSGNELYEFTKKVTGLRGEIGFVLGTPEATVLSVYDVYSWGKWMYGWYSENKVYAAVIHSRRYPNEQDLLSRSSKTQTIKEFIRFILQTEGQSLPENKIDFIIEQYNAKRGYVFKRSNS